MSGNPLCGYTGSQKSTIEVSGLGSVHVDKESDGMMLFCNWAHVVICLYSLFWLLDEKSSRYKQDDVHIPFQQV